MVMFTDYKTMNLDVYNAKPVVRKFYCLNLLHKHQGLLEVITHNDSSKPSGSECHARNIYTTFFK